jgi:hypothetical protein
LSVSHPLPEAEKLRRPGISVNSGTPNKTEAPNQFISATPNTRDSTQSKILQKHSVICLLTGECALHFLVKKNFSSRSKIKFIFFLSVCKLISSLKPAGEGSYKVHVNKL